MRHSITTGLVFAAVVSLCGCTSTKPFTWNPFALSKSGTTGTSTSLASKAPSAAGRDLSKAPAEAEENWLSTTWKNTTSSLTSAFQSKEKKEDPVALSTPAKTSPELYAAAGEIQQKGGDVNGAVAQYEKALELKPDDLKSRVGLARLYDHQGNATAALANYQKALEAHPESPLVHNDLGLYFARQRQMKLAVAELEEAIHLDPANPLFRNNLAIVLVEVGRDPEAFEHLSAVNPPAVAHYNYGYLLNGAAKREFESAATRARAETHRQAAVHELQTALQIDPSISAASTLLAQIQPGSAGTIANRNSTPVAPAGYPSGDSPVYQR